jgi:hypothetical protein
MAGVFVVLTWSSRLGRLEALRPRRKSDEDRVLVDVE